MGGQYKFESGDSRSSRFHLVIKGTMTQLVQEYTYISGIDLSCNILDGNIPEEIGFLKGLVTLNLSLNYFSNKIPATVGNMSSLDSLDLCSNGLYGHIPQTLTSINYLGFLNLSYNNLSGEIPREPHFDTLSLDGSAFAGNDLLCGFPLDKDCEGDKNMGTSDANPSNKVDEDDHEDANEKFLLYAIIAMGFAVGFWGLFCF
ncbi:putative receptor like protein 25 [Papaver somniferum]|uniref:putative receptor like protein 25 n=1 Tax=Papaver somniferum TaxID=3469 RepID=UPI000E701E69|nr:putative receptor like protein 25 [Papaver somniferum]